MNIFIVFVIVLVFFSFIFYFCKSTEPVEGQVWRHKDNHNKKVVIKVLKDDISIGVSEYGIGNEKITYHIPSEFFKNYEYDSEYNNITT